MNYFEFLGQPYNLLWLAALGAGLVALGLRRGRPTEDARTSIPVLLLGTGLVALTLNGALHDLRLGPIGPRQPMVATVSLAVGWTLAWGGPRLRRRIFPPVTAVRFNEAGLEGAVAVVLARGIRPGDDPGRARHHDAEGVSHILRVLPAGDRPLTFGMKVVLGPFDEARRAYPASPV